MTDLTVLDSKQLWTSPEVLNEIKNIYAKGATDSEFATFVGVGRATGLNPFKREIWFIKFGNNAAQIMVSRDGYRTSIGQNPNYESHIVDAVYENDEFEMDIINNKFHHKYNLKDRGKLVGAYCMVFMKHTSRPYYVFCELAEYDLNQSLWKTKKATMIKKVAESQCMRMADPNRYNGTYSEDELPSNKAYPQPISNPSLSTESVKERIIEQEKEAELTPQIHSLLDAMANAWDEEELRSIGEQIKNTEVPQSFKNQLANKYREKLAELRAQEPKKEIEGES